MAPPKQQHPSWGEPIDNAAHEAIRLAHRALERFPHVVARHKYIAGGAAVSSSLVVLAGVAITRRIRGGQSAEEAVNSVTEEEVQGLRDPNDDEPHAEARRRNGQARAAAHTNGDTLESEASPAPAPAAVNGGHSEARS